MKIKALVQLLYQVEKRKKKKKKKKKSKDNTFEPPCNLSQCENVESCLHNLPRLTQNLQWCLLAPGVTPAT